MNVFSGVALLLLGSSMLLYAEGSRCVPGFHSHGRSCYWFSDMTGTFAEARSICQFFGARLVIINSRAEDDFIRGYARGKAPSYFIGGSDLAREGRFVWEGGKPFAGGYQNWVPGQPNNYKGAEDCVHIWNGFGYRWNDAPCSYKYNFICEISK
ncbi:perlucin-like isoform X2 [Haliotis rufescens]|uniref:perlucin-like isoform X2 n=1 Tax=Haliotis rufescens TaxID=6454 RepID=UPI00201F5A94|nr:perlucin-like isoform X2 [Haliotis rufescens]